MIHDAQISKVSYQNKLNSGEILTQRDINRMWGEQRGEIDHLQKQIIDIFNQRSIIYKFRGKNHARIAYLDVPFHLLRICLSDLPESHTYQIHEPSTVNCRKGAVLFHYQPLMLLDMIREHLFNHNEPGQEPVFGEAGELSNIYEIPEYEYSPDFEDAFHDTPTELPNDHDDDDDDADDADDANDDEGAFLDALSPPSSSNQQEGLTVHSVATSSLSPVRERTREVSVDPVSPVTSPGSSVTSPV